MRAPTAIELATIVALVAPWAAGQGARAQPAAPARPVPELRFFVDPGVPAAVGHEVQRWARASIAFLLDDLELAGTVADRPLEVVVARDKQGMAAAGAARGRRLKLSTHTSAVTSRDTLYLNARYFLFGPKRPRTADETAFKIMEVVSHELAHAVVVRACRRNLPLWFSEGLAIHESIRFVRQGVRATQEADRFQSRRLATVASLGPCRLDELAFGRAARKRFYGKEHRRCYSTGLAAVLSIAAATGHGGILALVKTAGKGLPRKASLVERKLRWHRAVREGLKLEPDDLQSLMESWLARHGPRPVAEPQDEPDRPVTAR